MKKFKFKFIFLSLFIVSFVILSCIFAFNSFADGCYVEQKGFGYRLWNDDCPDSSGSGSDYVYDHVREKAARTQTKVFVKNECDDISLDDQRRVLYQRVNAHYDSADLMLRDPKRKNEVYTHFGSGYGDSDSEYKYFGYVLSVDEGTFSVDSIKIAFGQTDDYDYYSNYDDTNSMKFFDLNTAASQSQDMYNALQYMYNNLSSKTVSRNSSIYIKAYKSSVPYIYMLSFSPVGSQPSYCSVYYTGNSLKLAVGASGDAPTSLSTIADQFGVYSQYYKDQKNIFDIRNNYCNMLRTGDFSGDSGEPRIQTKYYISSPDALKFYENNFINLYCGDDKVTYNLYNIEVFKKTLNSKLKYYYDRVNSGALSGSFIADFTDADVIPGKSELLISGDKRAGVFTSNDDFRTLEYGKKFDSSDVYHLYCDYSNPTQREFLDEAKTVYNITANQHTYVAEERKDIYAHVHHDFNSEDKYDGDVLACTLICQETVEVDYGPPIVSHAGMCFQYEVQVSSTYGCNYERHDENAPPPDAYQYCDVIAHCINGDQNWAYDQGGSNEEFDNCIKSCDGGKYTSSCSNKCYKEVYGKSLSSKMDYSDELEISYKAQKLQASVSQKNNGDHYDKSGGTIYWTGHSTCGTYYSRHNRTHMSDKYGNYTCVDGFKRQLEKNGGVCNDTCYWTASCPNDIHYVKNTYLNDGDSTIDWNLNVKYWEEAIAECEAKATCVESSATFKISADFVNTNDGKRYTVEYPYTFDHDDFGTGSPYTLSSSFKDSTKCGQNNDSTSKIPNKYLIRNYAGCYRYCNNNPVYHTRWGFPGMFISEKYGTPVFVKTKDSNDTFVENIFCSPSYAADVNEWYYAAFVKKTFGSSSDFYDSDCNLNTIYDSQTLSTNVDWNIHAETRGFGHFGWNFDISCFYALYSPPSDSTTPDNPPTCTGGPSGDNYVIRTVDSTNLFPDREPGFNWRKGNPSDTGLNYIYPQYAGGDEDNIVVPWSYKEWIETTAKSGSFYNDDYLDYYFKLDSSSISQIRKFYKKANKESYNYVSNHGVLSYKSYLIRNILTGDSSKKRVPNESTFGCVNIENWRSTTCNPIK